MNQFAPVRTNPECFSGHAIIGAAVSSRKSARIAAQGTFDALTRAGDKNARLCDWDTICIPVDRLYELERSTGLRRVWQAFKFAWFYRS